MTTVTISEKRWSRGHRTGMNSLLVTQDQVFGDNPRELGTMCCLGFACLALGLKEEQIRGLTMPATVLRTHGDITEIPGLATWNTQLMRDVAFAVNTDFASRASEINDDGIITDEERKKKLQELAKKDGKFEFVFVP